MFSEQDRADLEKAIDEFEIGDGEPRDAARVLLASARVGGKAKDVAEALGWEVARVEVFAKRLNDNGVWRRDGKVVADWEDEDEGAMAFLCDLNVALGIMLRFVFVLALFGFGLSACFTYRAPTTSLSVVDEVPAAAVQVGTANLTWIDSSGCHSPTDDVIRKAEHWGADVLVPADTAPGRRFCRAKAYSTNTDAADPGRDWKGDPK